MAVTFKQISGDMQIFSWLTLLNYFLAEGAAEHPPRAKVTGTCWRGRVGQRRRWGWLWALQTAQPTAFRGTGWVLVANQRHGFAGLAVERTAPVGMRLMVSGTRSRVYVLYSPFFVTLAG